MVIISVAIFIRFYHWMLKTGRERNTAREEQQQRQQKRRQNPNKWLNGIRSVHSTHKIFPSYTFSPRIPCNKHTHNTLTRSFGAHSFFFSVKWNSMQSVWFGLAHSFECFASFFGSRFGYHIQIDSFIFIRFSRHVSLSILPFGVHFPPSIS